MNDSQNFSSTIDIEAEIATAIETALDQSWTVNVTSQTLARDAAKAALEVVRRYYAV